MYGKSYQTIGSLINMTFDISHGSGRRGYAHGLRQKANASGNVSDIIGAAQLDILLREEGSSRDRWLATARCSKALGVFLGQHTIVVENGYRQTRPDADRHARRVQMNDDNSGRQLRRSLTTFFGILVPNGAVPDVTAYISSRSEGVRFSDYLVGVCMEKIFPQETAVGVHFGMTPGEDTWPKIGTVLPLSEVYRGRQFTLRGWQAQYSHNVPPSPVEGETHKRVSLANAIITQLAAAHGE